MSGSSRVADRLEVLPTHKLFIGGAFPRSESGRSLAVGAARFAHASRKDLRDAVEAARGAQEKWAAMTASNRGQVLYRVAEMMEGRKGELAAVLADAAGRGTARRRPGAKPAAEVAAAIDRLVSFAGWADKYTQVLGCQNPVAGPYYNFTAPEPTGVVGVVAPDQPALLGLVSLIAPPLCAGNTIVALASETHPLAALILAEACATGDIPPGVVNILTGLRLELVPHFAWHRGIDAVHAADLPADQAAALRAGLAENLKRVVVRTGEKRGRGAPAPIDWHAGACSGPGWIEPFVEMKTVWHPAR